MQRFVKPLGVVLGLGLVVGLGPAVGQQAVPKENKGVNVGQTALLDLGAEIDQVQGRQLRLRVITIEPGGVVGIHTHNGRPAVAYIIKGSLTEYREGGYAKEWHAGDAWSEGKDVTHWAENKGPEPLVIVAADVFKPM
jgi:quercetin dioxygenase-like cupin family protein